MPSTRLTSQNWLTAGFDALQRDGQNALAAEPLARHLGTTKGSFYWHFKDVPAYHTALISHWRDRAMAALVEQLGDHSPADQRLRSFGTQVLGDPVEAAFRVWSKTHSGVADALFLIDTERQTYLTSLLRQLDLGNPDFARALIAALVGLPQILPDNPSAQSATFNTLVDTVLALSKT